MSGKKRIFAEHGYFDFLPLRIAMKQGFFTLFPALSLAILAACGRTHRSADDSPREILARMRADTAWIRELDSLAVEAIGPGTRCTSGLAYIRI